MRHLCILLLLIVSLSAVAQSEKKDVRGYIQGTVYDGKTKEVIESATIRLLTQADSTYIKGIASDEKGKFRLSASPGKYILEITFLGYKTIFQDIATTFSKPDFSAGDIYLEEKTVELGAAVVEAQVPNIVVKGDTIEYNAASYSSQESDMLQDMVRNIPGIEIDADGNIKANGKPVTKILVDGKEFFGNDIPMALANLPANMIKKLQLYKEESESAKITGFKDKNPDQVLNLVVKEELKQSVFGEVKAGYGSDDKYSHKALANYMRNENQISFVGDMNNVNDDDRSWGGGDGIDKHKIIGGNANIQATKELKVGGNIRYSNNENLAETRTNTQTFLTTGDRMSKNDMIYTNRRENTNFGINLEWKPDSMTTIYARSTVSLNDSKNENNSSTFSYVAGQDTTSGNSQSLNKGNGHNMNNSINIGRRLNNKGRVISLGYSNTFRKDDSKGTNYSKTVYSSGIEDKIIDQRSSTESNENNHNISMSYVEPFGKEHRLQFTYSYGVNNSERIRDVRRKDPNGNYTILDTAYTRNTENKFVNQNIGLNFQTTKEKYRYTIGISIDPSYSKSKISLGDSIIEDLKQNVVNFSPHINFSYNPNQNTSFDFNYSGSTSHPSIGQLSADTVIVSALSKHFGNPDLKPSYSNYINMYYQKSDYEKSRFFMIMGGFNYTLNNVVSYSTIDDLGNTTNTFRNVNGNMGANIHVMYDTPLKNKKFSINNGTYVNYNKSIGFTNGDKAITHNGILGEQAMFKFKIEKFETNLRAGITYNMTRNNLTNQQDRNSTNYTLNHYAIWRLPHDFTITSNLNYSYNTGYEDDFKKSEILWNASVSKQFLKKKKGTLKAQFFDILNDRNNVYRNVNGNYLSDSRTNSINRYFLVSFSYKFNIIRGKKSNENESDDEMGNPGLSMYY